MYVSQSLFHAEINGKETHHLSSLKETAVCRRTQSLAQVSQKQTQIELNTSRSVQSGWRCVQRGCSSRGAAAAVASGPGEEETNHVGGNLCMGIKLSDN